MIESIFNRIFVIYDQGHRQQSNYTCGPASLSLVSEALFFGKIDEGEWIHPRYGQWFKLEDFPNRGIALQELLGVAEMTLKDRAQIAIHRAYPENRALFRQDVKLAAENRCAVIVNFSQDYLTGPHELQGSPHYRVFEAMAFINPAFQVPRGWLTISPRARRSIIPTQEPLF